MQTIDTLDFKRLLNDMMNVIHLDISWCQYNTDAIEIMQSVMRSELLRITYPIKQNIANNPTQY